MLRDGAQDRLQDGFQDGLRERSRLGERRDQSSRLGPLMAGPSIGPSPDAGFEMTWLAALSITSPNE